MGMTEQEAIEIISKIEIPSSADIPAILEAFEIMKKATEKQIPKKLKTADVGYTMHGCPNCDHVEDLWSLKKRDKHCPNCGQALDWGNEGAE